MKWLKSIYNGQWFPLIETNTVSSSFALITADQSAEGAADWVRKSCSSALNSVEYRRCRLCFPSSITCSLTNTKHLLTDWRTSSVMKSCDVSPRAPDVLLQVFWVKWRHHGIFGPVDDQRGTGDQRQHFPADVTWWQSQTFQHIQDFHYSISVIFLISCHEKITMQK